MNDLEEHIKRVYNKLQQLLKQYQLLQKENGQLKMELSESKNRGETDLLRMKQLEQQVSILKSAAGQLNETDKQVFEKTIHQHIKEIDKCIALLSN